MSRANDAYSCDAARASIEYDDSRSGPNPLSIEQAASRWNVSPNTLRNWRANHMRSRGKTPEARVQAMTKDEHSWLIGGRP